MALISIPSTLSTVTLHHAVFPLDVVALMYVLPALTPVTLPVDEFTDAMLLLSDDHVTVVEALDGVMVYVGVNVSPTLIVFDEGDTLMLVGLGGVDDTTFIVQ